MPTVRAFGSSASKEYNWRDPLDLEAQLTEEEIMIRDAARNYCQVLLGDNREESREKRRASTTVN